MSGVPEVGAPYRPTLIAAISAVATLAIIGRSARTMPTLKPSRAGSRARGGASAGAAPTHRPRSTLVGPVALGGADAVGGTSLGPSLSVGGVGLTPHLAAPRLGAPLAGGPAPSGAGVGPPLPPQQHDAIPLLQPPRVYDLDAFAQRRRMSIALSESGRLLHLLLAPRVLSRVVPLPVKRRPVLLRALL